MGTVAEFGTTNTTQRKRIFQVDITIGTGAARCLLLRFLFWVILHHGLLLVFYLDSASGNRLQVGPLLTLP